MVAGNKIAHHMCIHSAMNLKGVEWINGFLAFFGASGLEILLLLIIKNANNRRVVSSENGTAVVKRGLVTEFHLIIWSLISINIFFELNCTQCFAYVSTGKYHLIASQIKGLCVSPVSLLQAEAAAPVGVCGPSSEGVRWTGGTGSCGGTWGCGGEPRMPYGSVLFK